MNEHLIINDHSFKTIVSSILISSSTVPLQNHSTLFMGPEANIMIIFKKT